MNNYDIPYRKESLHWNFGILLMAKLLNQNFGYYLNLFNFAMPSWLYKQISIMKVESMISSKVA